MNTTAPDRPRHGRGPVRVAPRPARRAREPVAPGRRPAPRRPARAAGLAAGLAVALLIVTGGGPSRAGAGAVAPREDPGRIVVVADGDTVWQIARRHGPEGVHQAVYAAEIVAHNGVDATRLVPGTVLRLPGR